MKVIHKINLCIGIVSFGLAFLFVFSVMPQLITSFSFHAISLHTLLGSVGMILSFGLGCNGVLGYFKACDEERFGHPK